MVLLYYGTQKERKNRHETGSTEHLRIYAEWKKIEEEETNKKKNNNNNNSDAILYSFRVASSVVFLFRVRCVCAKHARVDADGVAICHPSIISFSSALSFRPTLLHASPCLVRSFQSFSFVPRDFFAIRPKTAACKCVQRKHHCNHYECMMCAYWLCNTGRHA